MTVDWAKSCISVDLYRVDTPDSKIVYEGCRLNVIANVDKVAKETGLAHAG